MMNEEQKLAYNKTVESNAVMKAFFPKFKPDGTEIHINGPFLFLDLKAFIMNGDPKRIRVTMIEKNGFKLEEPEEIKFSGKGNGQGFLLGKHQPTGFPQTPLSLPNKETSYRYNVCAESAVLSVKIEDSYKGGDYVPSLLYDTKEADYNGEVKTYQILSRDAAEIEIEKKNKTKRERRARKERSYADANLYVSAAMDHRRIKVHVLEGRDLKAADRNLIGKASSDPYVMMKMNGIPTKRTKTIKKKLCPVWNHSFDIAWPLCKKMEDITLAVMDKDTFSSDDFLGQAVISSPEIIDLGKQIQGAVETHKKWVPVMIGGVAHGELLVCATTYTARELLESGYNEETTEKGGFLRACFDGLRMSSVGPVQA